jgi:hypothetical protein
MLSSCDLAATVVLFHRHGQWLRSTRRHGWSGMKLDSLLVNFQDILMQSWKGKGMEEDEVGGDKMLVIAQAGSLCGEPGIVATCPAKSMRSTTIVGEASTQVPEFLEAFDMRSVVMQGYNAIRWQDPNMSRGDSRINDDSGAKGD